MHERYEVNVFASSFFRLGIQENKLKEFYEEFAAFTEMIKQMPQLNRFLLSPKIKRDEKKAFLNKVLGNQFSQEFISFIIVILIKRCQFLYKKIFNQFQELVDRHENVSRAKVYSVQKLDQKTLDNIAKLLSERFKKKIVLIPIIDEKILGGLILQVEDVQIDMSIQHSLEQLKDKILSTKVGGTFS